MHIMLALYFNNTFGYPTTPSSLAPDFSSEPDKYIPLCSVDTSVGAGLGHQVNRVLFYPGLTQIGSRAINLIYYRSYSIVVNSNFLMYVL